MVSAVEKPVSLINNHRGLVFAGDMSLGEGEHVRVRCFACPSGTWEVALARPHPRLRSAIHTYYGFRKNLKAWSWEGFPSGAVNLLLGFDVERPQRFFLQTDAAAETPFTSLLSGLSTRSSRWLDHDGHARGVNVTLAPWAAFTMFGVEMHELAGTIVEPDDLPGDRMPALLAALAVLPGWEQRFHLLDEVLSQWLTAGPAWSPRVEWAYDQLLRSGGTIPIRKLAVDSGWRPRQLEYRFKEQIGLSPKAAARVLRFRRAAWLLADGRTPVQAAAVCGFSDQAHMSREFKIITGVTPTRFRTKLGAAADVLATIRPSRSLAIPAT